LPSCVVIDLDRSYLGDAGFRPMFFDVLGIHNLKEVGQVVRCNGYQRLSRLGILASLVACLHMDVLGIFPRSH
jgi:hypothetical protein